MSSLWLISILLSLILILYPSYSYSTSSTTSFNRRILHHPFYSPESSTPPTQPPTSSPPPKSQHKPYVKQPSSTTPTPTTTPNSDQFFPAYPMPPPPPPPPAPTTSTNALPTFPANISSLVLPRTSSSPSHSPVSTKLVVIFVLLSLLVITLIAALAIVHFHRRRHAHRGFHPNEQPGSDDVRLYPSHISTSDGHPPKLGPNQTGLSTTSSEFLYLGTLATSCEFDKNTNSHAVTHYEDGGGEPTGSSDNQKVESPEIHPLPPLPRENFPDSRQKSRNFELGFTDYGRVLEDDEEEFFSPRGSSGRMGLSSSSRKDFEAVYLGNRSAASSIYQESDTSSAVHSATASPSPFLDSTTRSLKSDSPEFITLSPLIRTPSVINNYNFPSPGRISSLSDSHESCSRNSASSSEASVEVQVFVRKSETLSERSVLPTNLPPGPPPPSPPPRYWENATSVPESQQEVFGPPPHIPPSGPIVFQSSASLREHAPPSSEIVSSETVPKPKLKPLHWDKVRASSDKATVWDNLKPCSFQLNEEMIETLFVVNGSNSGSKKTGPKRSIIPLLNQETGVLDPKKSQNVAILLRALNVTAEEVCEGLLEGNVDTLGTELLESLLKMAPTKEEEKKLREYKDESPLKLGPAEKFLIAVLDIPFAFKRVDAMLYIANFDSEVEYIKKSFDALEAACEALRNSRMFLKLLDTILKTGNRMNVGTTRGDAQAFKLDTLLKLVDIKGADGKTTLLHFVVQEIIRFEGSRLSQASHNRTKSSSDLEVDIESRKRGLEVVAGLGGELSNVKKAAAMDSDVLSNDVGKLGKGIAKVGEVLKLIEDDGFNTCNNNKMKFAVSMGDFLKKAEVEIQNIQVQGNTAFSKVKDLTEYFHGNLAKEEAHPLRIFTVVKDFLSALDQVCKEVGKINERTVISSVRHYSSSAAPYLPLFPVLKDKQRHVSSEF